MRQLCKLGGGPTMASPDSPQKQLELEISGS